MKDEKRSIKKLEEEVGSAEELARRADEYLAKCREEGRRPTRPGLRAVLGLREEELRTLETGQGKEALPWRRAVCRAMELIRDEMEQGKDTMTVFLLKQPCYGGYTDKPVGESGKEQGPAQLHITFQEKGREQYGG